MALGLFQRDSERFRPFPTESDVFRPNPTGRNRSNSVGKVIGGGDLLLDLLRDRSYEFNVEHPFVHLSISVLSVNRNNRLGWNSFFLVTKC